MSEIYRIYVYAQSLELANCYRDICAGFFMIFEREFPPKREDVELISAATNFPVKYVFVLPSGERSVIMQKDWNVTFDEKIGSKVEFRQGSNGLIEASVCPRMNSDFDYRFAWVCASYIMRCRAKADIPRKPNLYAIYILSKTDESENDDAEAEMLSEFHRFAVSRDIPRYSSMDSAYIDRYPELPLRRKAFLCMLSSLHLNGILCKDDEFLEDPLTSILLDYLAITVIKV